MNGILADARLRASVRSLFAGAFIVLVAVGFRWIVGPDSVLGRVVSYGSGIVAAAAVGYVAKRAGVDNRAAFRLVALFTCVLFVCVAIGRLGAGARVVVGTGEQDYGEGIIYAQANRLLRGEQLYQPFGQEPYTVVAYTPLYYAVAAALQRIFGPGWMAGRAVSYVAGLSTAILVGSIVRRRTRARLAGLLAAALVIVLAFPSRSAPWFALYKEDVLGVALSIAAIALLLGSPSRSRVVGAAVLAALALLTKQTFVASGLAGAIWLLSRDRAAAGVFIGTLLALVAGAASALELRSGAFWSNTVIANVVPFSMSALRPEVSVYVQFQAAPLVIAVAYALSTWRRNFRWQPDLCQLYWAASALPMVGLGKVGSNTNYWIEFGASTAIVAVVGVWQAQYWHGLNRVASIMALALLVGSLLYVMPTFGGSAVPVLSIIEDQGGDEGVDLAPVIERIRAEPGPVLADPLDVVALAGKEILLEPYLFNILYRQDRWNPQPFVRRICQGEIGLAVFAWPLDAPPTTSYHGYAFQVLPVLNALRRAMVLDTEQGGRFVYIRAPITASRSDPDACSRLAMSE